MNQEQRKSRSRESTPKRQEKTKTRTCLNPKASAYGGRISPKEAGASIVIVLIGAALLIASGIILISNSHWFFRSALKASDFRNARDVSEYGAAAITEELNTDGKSYLLVVQPACWQSSSIDVAGIFMPPGITAGANKINGVITNTSEAQWQVVPLKQGQSTAQAVSSGSYARYQLTDYTPPQTPGGSTNYPFGEACPSSSSNQFGNRYGGSAFLTIRGELWRKGKLESEHTITQEVHVKGVMASSFGETSLVLKEGGELNTIKPYVDLNNNNEKDDNEPWLDIFCVQCTGTTQEELRNQPGPVGIGLQGVMANNYDGYIYTGDFIFPPFPFEDLDSNSFQDEATELAYPQALKTALESKASTWKATPYPSNSSDSPPWRVTNPDGTEIGNELHKKLAESIPLYRSASSSDTTSLGSLEIAFCANNGTGSNIAPCSDSKKGDIERIDFTPGTTPSISSSGTYYVSREDLCSALGFTKPYCDATRIAISVESGSFEPENLAQGSDHYPYTSSSKTELVSECANMGTYIGCVVNAITLNCKDADGAPICGGVGGQEVTVISTLNSSGSVIPVYIYVTGTSMSGDTLDTKQKVVDFSGGQTLINQLGNRPDALRIYGSPPIADTSGEDASCANKNQVIGIGGTGDVKGIWAWLPRGLIDAGSGTGVVSGALWACDFQGNGTFSFLGSNQNITRNQCGINLPCGLYKYRAQGIAQVERL